MTGIQKTIPAAAVLFALAAPSALAEPAGGNIYRWIDDNGEVHYSDRAPPGNEADAVYFTSKAPAASQSYPTRRAAKDFPVTLYTAVNCKQLCEDARTFLNKRKVPFTEAQIRSEDDATAFYKRFGEAAEIPILTVGATSLRGFEPQRWNNQIDQAGYPK
ncbi:MAG: glutaredoxin family protein [Azoarcus sp.]|jgi:hypothetical protein|nr:glutaredoxin family protein [Azoarcus sp.]